VYSSDTTAEFKQTLEETNQYEYSGLADLGPHGNTKDGQNTKATAGAPAQQGGEEAFEGFGI